MSTIDRLYREACKASQGKKIARDESHSDWPEGNFVTQEPYGEQAWTSVEEYEEYLRSIGESDFGRWKNEWGMGAG